MESDYWESMEPNEANWSMGESWDRTYSPMVCDNCQGLHTTMTCPYLGEVRYCEDEANWSMNELYMRQQFYQEPCNYCGGEHDIQECQLAYNQQFSWSDNMGYHDWHDPNSHQDEFFELPPPDIQNQVLSPPVEKKSNLESLMEQYIVSNNAAIRNLETQIGQLVKLMECQPQENMSSQGDECSNEPTIEIQIKDEEAEFVKETNEEENPAIDIEVIKRVNPILAIVESNPDVLMKKEPLIKVYEQEEEFIKVDFVMEFLPEQYLKIKRQREIEFILRIQDKDRKNKRSRKEEPTSKRSRPHTMGHAFRGSLSYILKDELGTANTNDSDTIPFDPGG